MKNPLLFIVSTVLTGHCIAQKRCTYPACRIDFVKNKLYIVQTGQPAFDSALKLAITAEWTVSPVGGYITKASFESMKRLDGNSFLEPARYNWYIPKNPSEREERGACVLNFFEGHTAYPSVYINYESIDLLEGYPGDQFDSSIYRLQLIIRGRNSYYKNAAAKNTLGKTNGLALLKTKILLINEADVHNGDAAKNWYEAGAFDKYAYKVEFANATKIESLIQPGDSNYVLGVRLVNNLAAGFFLFDVATGVSLGHLDTKEWPGALRRADIEALVKKINE